MSEQRLIPEGPDPINNTTLEVLRLEILRLRDLNLGLKSKTEVLVDRVAELETQNDELDRALSELSRNAENTISELGVLNQELNVHNQELNVHNQELNVHNQELLIELGRSPLIRIARAIARRLKLR